ncbi:MAG TPA: hypothetical protein VGB51_10540 [Actinomycetota bacterium]
MSARRAVLVAAVAMVLVPGAGLEAAGARRAELHRAQATAVAVHGFYDHEELFPVSILNLSVPFASARLEPGPASEALGSFLWDPEAAELGTIVCVLSGDRLCQLPDYPFQATATHPSAGGDGAPPSIEMDEPGSPVLVRAAGQAAEATARGATADAAIARLAAIPMTPEQSAAVRALAVALGPAADPPTPFLIEIRSASSASETRGAAAATGSATSIVHGLDLLGGLVGVDSAHGRASASSSGEAAAAAGVGSVTVGDLRARIGRGGIEIADRRVGREEVAAISEALDQALGEAGFRLSPGRERARRTARGSTAEAYAFSLDVRRRNLPDQLPEGTTGADVLRVPVALAIASAEATALPAFASPGGRGAGGGEAEAGGSSGAGGTGPVTGSSTTTQLPTTAPASGGSAGSPAAPDSVAPEAGVPVAPLAGFLASGVPSGGVLLSALLALLLVIGLTALKSLEVLSE